jgi:uncharacterized Zn finger protein
MKLLEVIEQSTKILRMKGDSMKRCKKCGKLFDEAIYYVEDQDPRFRMEWNDNDKKF